MKSTTATYVCDVTIAKVFTTTIIFTITKLFIIAIILTVAISFAIHVIFTTVKLLHYRNNANNTYVASIFTITVIFTLPDTCIYICHITIAMFNFITVMYVFTKANQIIKLNTTAENTNICTFDISANCDTAVAIPP